MLVPVSQNLGLIYAADRKKQGGAECFVDPGSLRTTEKVRGLVARTSATLTLGPRQKTSGS
jgi:hypothetical protein